MEFSPHNVKILDKGSSYTGTYQVDNACMQVELRFHDQGRVRLIVHVNNKLAEDIELRMPTTHSMNAKTHATALILSAIDRHR